MILTVSAANALPFGSHSGSVKDRAHFLSTLSAEMKVEMPKIGASRFKYLQTTLLLCFYAFIMTEHHIFNHLEGHINRNGNEFMKHFAEFL